VDAYRRAGVDLDAARDAVSLIRDLARGASRPEVVAGVGGFAGLFRLDEGRLLAAAADGVGTKVDLAQRLGRLDTVGIDLVAMSANDLVCTGAEPLFFMDYVVTATLVPDQVAALVTGVAEGCRRAGCALLGGETAEHPGHLAPEAFDLAGFCVGIVDAASVLDPGRVREGDVLVGLASSGVHANGFSLIRRLLDERDIDLDQAPEPIGRSLGEELLEPTEMYVRPVLAGASRGLVRSAAHVTGGGIQENVPRALSDGLGARLDLGSWPRHPIFDLLGEWGSLTEEEMARTFNVGLGMVLVAAPEDAEPLVRATSEAGARASMVGEVIRGEGVLFE
jgi:phosphoribosylformylglycinamidine cyclo-ligase